MTANKHSTHQWQRIAAFKHPLCNFQPVEFKIFFLSTANTRRDDLSVS